MKIGSTSVFLQQVIFSTIMLSTAHGWAQALYSANVVGYADVNLVTGSNLVANPFNAANNTVSNLFQGLPDGAVLLRWNNASQAFVASNVYHAATGWTDPNATLVFPRGAFLVMPSPLKISFVGEAGTRRICHSFKNFDITIMPNTRCTFCSFGPCQFLIPNLTGLSKWNPASQTWEYFLYFEGSGWVDSNLQPVESPLGPAEPGMFLAAEYFDASFVHAFTFGEASGPPVRLFGAQRSGPDLSFHVTGSSNGAFTLFQSTDLGGSWVAISNGIATSSNGNLVIRTPLPTNDFAFYKISTLAAPATLSNPSRTGTQFQFQFYAAHGVSYTVQRALSPDSPPWETISTVIGDGEVKTVTDASATAPLAYYRLRF